MDQDLGHEDGQGPTSRKLAEFPPVLDLVFGAFGETSEGVKSLLDTLVKSRLRKLGQTKGTSEAAKESAWVTGYLRRRLSSSVIKSNIREERQDSGPKLLILPCTIQNLHHHGSF